jgi:hypothetical protein
MSNTEKRRERCSEIEVRDPVGAIDGARFDGWGRSGKAWWLPRT